MIKDLWFENNIASWEKALEDYWKFVQPRNLELEKKFDQLDVRVIEDIDDWYDFLLYEYFRWKYTAPNRYASTTMHFKKKYKNNRLQLNNIIASLFGFDKSNIKEGLILASQISGLGIAGASGLLSIIFPKHFATADQFVVKALRQIDTLEEHKKLLDMNPDSLRERDGVILIRIMRNKAFQLNNYFSTDFWTPRRIDMVLWAYRD